MARARRAGSDVERRSRRAASTARLRYASDSGPGLRRVRRGRGFAYLDTKGRAITEVRTVARIKSLAIPPAWTDVWIAPTSNGHIQATGRDDRGRKQFIYHPRWVKARAEDKFGRLGRFIEVLPRLHRRVGVDLSKKGLPREKVHAAVVSLLESTSLRVGSEAYAKSNRTFGLTTLRDRHVRLGGGPVRLIFTGKHGKQVEATISDRRLIRVVRQCHELPGQRLFQYVDEDGRRHSVTSTDVNDYLKDATGEDLTAKDFRTLAGSLIAVEFLARKASGGVPVTAKKAAVEATDAVAMELGNTRAIARDSYVHPKVLAAIERGVKSPIGDKPAKALLGLVGRRRAVT